VTLRVIRLDRMREWTIARPTRPFPGEWVDRLELGVSDSSLGEGLYVFPAEEAIRSSMAVGPVV